MSDLKVQGQLKEILKPESGVSKAGKEWSKQDFVIETSDQYPKLICCTLFGDKTSLIQGSKVGDNLDVFINIESREYNGRYFHNINAWRVEVLSEQTTQQAPPPEPEPDGNDLPF